MFKFHKSTKSDNYYNGSLQRYLIFSNRRPTTAAPPPDHQGLRLTTTRFSDHHSPRQCQIFCSNIFVLLFIALSTIRFPDHRRRSSASQFKEGNFLLFIGSLFWRVGRFPDDEWDTLGRMIMIMTLVKYSSVGDVSSYNNIS